MKSANSITRTAIVLALGAFMATTGEAQSRFAQSTPGGASGGGSSGSGGYTPGGGRGGVVQVISDAEVQAELSLSRDQRQRIDAILERVKTIEDELREAADQLMHAMQGQDLLCLSTSTPLPFTLHLGTLQPVTRGRRSGFGGSACIDLGAGSCSRDLRKTK